MSDKIEGISITGGEEHWRSLEEQAADPAEREAIKQTILNKFPTHFLSRREFVEWTAGLTAVLGLTNCTRQPQERIMPYTRQPENLIPGKPLYFASSFVHHGASAGVLVESHMGRPTKIEGNPEHPSSLGATSLFAQASVLDLYDPDRLRMPTYKYGSNSYTDFNQALMTALREQLGKGGAGLRILTEAVLSPTLGAQLRAVLAKFPKAKWVTHDPVSRGNARAGAELAFGEAAHVHYRLDRVATVVSFDSDFLFSGPGAVRYAKDFAARRKGDVRGAANASRLRLYQFECTPSVTGGSADHVWPVRPANLVSLAQAVARELGVEAGISTPLDGDLSAVAKAVAQDLSANAGASLVVTGDWQPAELHALCHAMNAKLGNFGKTVLATGWLEENPASGGIAELTAEMTAGQVEVLAILGGNPVYSQPAGTGFEKALAGVKLSFHHTLHPNETSTLCTWQLPDTHYLEMWGDSKAHDGTATVIQPLIAPLYGSRSAYEMAAALAGNPNATGYQELQSYWKTKNGTGFERYWSQAVHDGVFGGSLPAEKRVAVRGGAAGRLAAPKITGMTAIFRPDPCVWDGRSTNNGWLLELPRPTTKLTWDNAVLMAPATAAKLGVKNGDVVVVKTGDRSLEGPAWLTPGQPEDTVTLPLGYGRTAAGSIGNKVGFDANRLRTGASQWLVADVKIGKAGRTHVFAQTQTQGTMEGRDLVRTAPLAKYVSAGASLWPSAHHAPEGHGAEHGGGHGTDAHGAHETPATGDPHGGSNVFNDKDYAWGMAIDLATCNGCNACMVACQSENNIPVVGKDEVYRQRAMHWIRVDRYYAGPPANPETHFQPVPCMHCETAPCTVVCPVGATTIAPDGINEMTYNRCVGTKYCSNNCPYKVRRFNFYHYADVETPQLQLRHNPDVTVRSRGVMEKCTYCVQRVSQARIEAKKEERLVRDGEVTPACAGACPSSSIVFGNLKDANSRVSQLKKEPRNYGLLEELGTKPRTTYLAKIRNPNPAIADGLARKSF